MKITKNDVDFLDVLQDAPELEQRHEDQIKKLMKFDSSEGTELLTVSPFTVTIDGGGMNGKIEYISSYLYTSPNFQQPDNGYVLNFPSLISNEDKRFIVTDKARIKITANSLTIKTEFQNVKFTKFNPALAEKLYGTSNIDNLMNYEMTGEREY